MRLLPVLALLVALVGCSAEDPDDDSTGGSTDAGTGPAIPTTTTTTTPAGDPAPASCARVSATDLASWLGAGVSISDQTDDPDVVSCDAIGDPSTYVAVQWTVADAPPTAGPAPGSVARASAEGPAEDGRTVFASAIRFHPDSEVTDAALQTAVDRVVAAYAVPGPPPATDDACALVTSADASEWAGFPIEVRETDTSQDDVVCTTVVGDENADNALATVEWRLTPPDQTLAYEADALGQGTDDVTLPGGEPAVIGFADDAGRATVAAQAGEQTVVVEVTRAFSDAAEYPDERIQRLALTIADVYAR